MILLSPRLRSPKVSSGAKGVSENVFWRLGKRLLDRTTRMVSPTAEGQEWYYHCLRLLADFEDAEASLRDNAPKGRVRLDVNGPLFRHFLLPNLPPFLAQYPELELVISETETLIDLVGEGVDCVLRAGPLTESGLIQRPLALLPEITAAAPCYLERVGPLHTLADLNQNHKMIGFFSSRKQAVLSLEFTEKTQIIERRIPLALTVTGADSMIEAAKMGLGIMQAPRYRMHEALKKGTLVEILPDHPPEALPISILYPEGRRTSPRVSVLIDWLLQIDFRV